MKIKQQFAARLVEQFAKRGMLAELVEGALVCMVKPDIGKHKVAMSFRRPDWVVEPTLWFNSWWAKLLRKVEHWARRRLGRPLLPAWLDSLVFSESVRVGCKKESLPIDAVERIAAMANYLRYYEKVEPSKVLVGRKVMIDLRRSYCADYWPGTGHVFGRWHPIDIVLGNKCSAFGLRIEISPFLAEDEILVV